ncbi:hypothetical protein BGZ63DRAFT_130703 [Mariannaea sp. PMI_226]|nr:hypothetical protein BGZ63DRAFT_130703 [Mariannaea sp. PMI_226]
MAIPPNGAQAQAFIIPSTAPASSISSSPLTEEKIMHQSTPFDGDHQGSFDPSGNDFSTNIDINTGTFVGGVLDHVAITQGLDSLGNCQNSENGCLDQRCYHVISNAAAASSQPSDTEMTDSTDAINLEADLPLIGLQSTLNNSSTNMTYGNQNYGQTIQNVDHIDQTGATEPLAALQSLHQKIHQACHQTHNQASDQMSAPGGLTSFQSLHQNFHQILNQYPDQCIGQEFNQTFCHSFPGFPDQPVNQFSNQAFTSTFNTPFGGQVHDANGFVIQQESSQIQWGQDVAITSVPNWGTVPMNLMNNPMHHTISPEVAGSRLPKAPASCSSHCEIPECTSQCGESANGNCCFDPSCALDANHELDLSNCCSHESCHDPEPCLEENCQGASHPCNDAACIGTADSNTPATASVPTPPATESDPIITSVATPVDLGGYTGMVMGKPFTSPIVGGTVDGIVVPWASNSPAAKAGPRSTASSMGEDDLFRCRWVFDNGLFCHEAYLNAEDLQNHCKKEHGKKLVKGERGFICRWQGCSRHEPFAQKSKLERHMQTHTGFKPVKCDICGLKLSAKQSLEQHKRTHSGELPWRCPYEDCGSAFKQQSALTMHIRTHTGEKPLRCDICDKAFSESSNLSKHRRTHNVKGNHVCEYCGKDFHRLDQLRRHLRKTHKVGDGEGDGNGDGHEDSQPNIHSTDVVCVAG